MRISLSWLRIFKEYDIVLEYACLQMITRELFLQHRHQMEMVISMPTTLKQVLIYCRVGTKCPAFWHWYSFLNVNLIFVWTSTDKKKEQFPHNNKRRNFDSIILFIAFLSKIKIRRSTLLKYLCLYVLKGYTGKATLHC